MPEKLSTKTIAQNKKAHHDYFVEESLEAGIERSEERRVGKEC